GAFDRLVSELAPCDGAVGELTAVDVGVGGDVQVAHGAARDLAPCDGAVGELTAGDTARQHVAFDAAIDVRNAYEIPIVSDAGDRERPLCGNLWLNLDRSRGAAKSLPVSRLNNNRRGCRALVDGDEQTSGARVEHYPLLAALRKPHRDVGVLGVVAVLRDQFFVDHDLCRSRSARANVDVADVIAGALGFAGGGGGGETDDATALRVERPPLRHLHVALQVHAKWAFADLIVIHRDSQVRLRIGVERGHRL